MGTLKEEALPRQSITFKKSVCVICNQFYASEKNFFDAEEVEFIRKRLKMSLCFVVF
jgi:hypothetical protein